MSIVFEVSRDPRLLEQYYELREQCFREELGLQDFNGAEQIQDLAGQILVAHQDGKCLGGVRISPDVSLRGNLQELDLTPEVCCMWERFVIDPALRTVAFFRDFTAQLIQASRELGYSNALVLSSLRNARFYRLCHSALGVGFEIHGSVPQCAQGAFSGLEHYLSVSNLRYSENLKMAA